MRRERAMKAITLHQPWASLVVVGAKTVETRSWATSYRGPLVVHAGKRPPAGSDYDPGARPRIGEWAIERLRGPAGIEWAIERPDGQPGWVRRIS